MHVWAYTGEVGAKRLREKYLQAVLRQDISFFDSVGAGETATRIQTDTREDEPSLFASGADEHHQIWFNKAHQKRLQSSSAICLLLLLGSCLPTPNHGVLLSQ